MLVFFIKKTNYWLETGRNVRPQDEITEEGNRYRFWQGRVTLPGFCGEILIGIDMIVKVK